MRAGERDKAEEFFNKGIEVNPLFLLSYLERANFYFYNDEFEKAAKDYNMILDIAFAIPESRDSRTALLVREIHTQMMRHQLRPELQATYDKIEAYWEKVE
jgi:tetratricopeptide (TPR) repeat protein